LKLHVLSVGLEPKSFLSLGVTDPN